MSNTETELPKTNAERLSSALLGPAMLTPAEWSALYEKLYRAYERIDIENEHLRMQLMFLADHRRPQ
jgi:hypothetical protein